MSRPLGTAGYMVQTGKSRAAEVEASGVEPDRTLTSVVALPALLLG